MAHPSAWQPTIYLNTWPRMPLRNYLQLEYINLVTKENPAIKFNFLIALFETLWPIGQAPYYIGRAAFNQNINILDSWFLCQIIKNKRLLLSCGNAKCMVYIYIYRSHMLTDIPVIQSGWEHFGSNTITPDNSETCMLSGEQVSITADRTCVRGILCIVSYDISYAVRAYDS